MSHVSTCKIEDFQIKDMKDIDTVFDILEEIFGQKGVRKSNMIVFSGQYEAYNIKTKIMINAQNRIEVECDSMMMSRIQAKVKKAQRQLFVKGCQDGLKGLGFRTLEFDANAETFLTVTEEAKRSFALKKKQDLTKKLQYKARQQGQSMSRTQQPGSVNVKGIRLKMRR